MKLTFLILLLSLFGVFNVEAQNRTVAAASNPGGFHSLLAHDNSIEALQEPISVDFDGVTLAEGLAEIAGKSGLGLSYSPDTVPVDRLISLQIEEASVAEALEALIANTSLKVLVTEGGEIVIVEGGEETAKGSDLIAISQRAAVSPLQISQLRQLVPVMQHEVAGRVTAAETGEPVPGVNVVEQGTDTGTTTNADGDYELTISSDDAVLIFSFVGYDRQEVQVEGRSEIDVALVESVGVLDDLVVVGYGTVRARDLTGSVSSVDPDELTTGVESSFEQMIQGRISGVQVTQASAEPGGGYSIRIRGANSITAGNEPLYVIDGLPGAPQSALNTSDIESIEVLKDASATAIYGSRGANGVILITTKQGAPGETVFAYDGRIGLQEPAKQLDLMNAQQYMSFINDIRVEQGAEPLYTQEEINAIGQGTNWQDEVLQSAPLQNHELSLSGGSDDTQYYASLNLYNQEGIVINSGMQRYAGRVNLNHSRDRFDFGLNLNASLQENNNVPMGVGVNRNAGVIATAIQLDPIMPVRNDDGTYAQGSGHDMSNPVAQANTIDINGETNRVFGNVFGEYNFLDELNARINIGFNRNTSRNDNFISTATQRGQFTNGQASISQSISSNYLAELTLNYDNVLREDHVINAVAGYTFQEFESKHSFAQASDFPSDAFRSDNLSIGSPDNYSVNSGRSVNTLLSGLGRVNYSFRSKYLVTASFRVDGSSRFGDHNKYGYFPSVALGWRLSEEPFMSDFGFLSDLKARGSYGITGNQEIGNYNSLVLLGPSSDQAAVFDGQEFTAIGPVQLGNPDLKWETTTQYNIGLDFGFLGDRVTGSMDYFVNETSDLLLQLPIPRTSGFSSSLQNVGDTRNSGFEFMISSRNLVGEFSWTTNFNLSTLRNEVTNLGELPFILQGNTRFISDYTILREGEPINSYYGYVVDGIFQSQQEIDGSAQPDAKPGDLIFRDISGDGTISADDRTILGDPFPDFTFGLDNSFTYKGLSLAMFLEARLGNQMVNFTRIDSENPIESLRNRETYVLNRWTRENPSDEHPSFRISDQSRAMNSRVVEDASFLRLRNVNLSYTLPASLNLGGFSSLTVYARAQNVLTITDYSGYNPDVSVFGSSNIRADYNAYPLARSFTLGMNVQF